MTNREKLNLVEGVEIGERLELAKMLSDQLDGLECKKLADYIRGPLLGLEDALFPSPAAPAKSVKAELVFRLKGLCLTVVDLLETGLRKIREGVANEGRRTPF